MRYWVGVASKDHVEIGTSENFCQLCHGKRAPLNRMKSGDWLIYYAPKQNLKSATPYQKFIAIGEIISEEAYQVEMFPGFFPFRKDVNYQKQVQPCSLQQVNQIPLWGEYRSRLRYGHFEIPEALFKQIAFLMNAKIS